MILLLMLFHQEGGAAGWAKADLLNASGCGSTPETWPETIHLVRVKREAHIAALPLLPGLMESWLGVDQVGRASQPENCSPGALQ